MIQQREELSLREREEMSYQKEMYELQAQHAKEIKQMELEVAKLEAKFSSLFRIPLQIIRLPLLLVLGIAYCIAVVRKHEPSEQFWTKLK